MLHDLANHLVRGRIAVAAGCAIVGLAAAVGWPPWPAAPLLICALLLALATLAAAITFHHLPSAAFATRITLVALLLAFDASALVGTAAAERTAGAAALLAVALAAAFAIHFLALTRGVAQRAPWPPPAPSPAATGPEDSTASDELGVRARESIGIVRARAESLRLAAEEAGVLDLLQHDLDVLVRQAEECQRALRELDHPGEPGGRGSARLLARAVPDRVVPRGAQDRDGWPSESTPLRS